MNKHSYMNKVKKILEETNPDIQKDLADELFRETLKESKFRKKKKFQKLIDKEDQNEMDGYKNV